MALLAAILIGCPTPLEAGQSFGQWYVDTSDDNGTIIAGTTNDSGSILMEACKTSVKTCSWMIIVSTSCENGSTYSALGSSDSGAAVLTITCDGKSPNGGYRYILNWKEIESLIKGGKNFGMAVAVVDGKFFVHRFSLNGMTSATQNLETSFNAIIKKNDAGTGTIVL